MMVKSRSADCARERGRDVCILEKMGGSEHDCWFGEEVLISRNAREIVLLRARIEALESKIGGSVVTVSTPSPPPASSPQTDSILGQAAAPMASVSPTTGFDLQISPSFPFAAYSAPSVNTVLSPPALPTPAGPCWSRFLAPIGIDKKQHDLAIQTFVSYYSPWCSLIDYGRFLQDMAAMPDVGSKEAGYMTAHYSAVLHNAMYFTGTYMLKERWPDVMEKLDKAFWNHVNQYVSVEGDQPTLATLSGFVVLSS